MSQIILCPKSVPKVGKGYEEEFVFFYLKRTKSTAIIPNECWSTIKKGVLDKFLIKFNNDVIEAQKKSEIYLAEMRSWLSPENEVIDEYGKDIILPKEHSLNDLVMKTKDLVNRKWRIIKYFIVVDKNDFIGVDSNVIPIPIDKFLIFCMSQEVNSCERKIAEDFVQQYHFGNSYI